MKIKSKKILIIISILLIIIISINLEEDIEFETEIKLISYNIHSGFDSNMYPTLFDTIDFLKRNNPDIVCLQEVNESAKAGFQVSSFKEELNMNSHFGANVVDLQLNYGLVTYTKYPIKKEDHIYLSSYNEQRGFLHTVVNVNKRKLNIINVHLGLGDEREVQLEELIKFIEKLKNEYFIVVGDFNENDIKMDNKIITDAAKEMNKSNLLTFPKGLERIDYVFASKNIKIKSYDIPTINISDHYPIVVTIKM